MFYVYNMRYTLLRREMEGVRVRNEVRQNDEQGNDSIKVLLQAKPHCLSLWISSTTNT